MLDYNELFSREERLISATLERELAALDSAAQPLVRHTVAAGGKRIRPMLLVLVGQALTAAAPSTALNASSGPDSNSSLYQLACAVEFIHNATLMHDDIIDDAATRRGRPAAHTVFGAQRAVLGGDILLAAAMQLVLRHRDYPVMDALAEAISATAVGQVREIAALRNPALGYAEYLDIITGKTACLISGACKAGALKAKAAPAQVEAAARYGLELGRVFQLVDDALDIAPEEEIGKPTGGDLREGKFTPVLDFYLKALPAAERQSFEARFAAAELGEEEIAQAVRQMRALGCDEKTRQLAESHLALALAALEEFPPGEYRLALARLAEYVRTRKL